MIHNSLSVDLESFIHREFDIKERKTKDNGFTRSATKYLLDLFDTYNTKATFFTVGEIYEWYPDLIQEIDAKGHEIAYHSHRHMILKNEEILLSELSLSKEFLKKYKPVGFRAPRMYIKKSYLNILKNFGFKYDSSIYGQYIESIPETSIKEMPVSAIALAGEIKNTYPQNFLHSLLRGAMPFGSGFMISLFQKKIQDFVNAANRRKRPAILFIHPWQLLSYRTDESLKTLMHLPKNLYRNRINETIEFLLAKNKFVPLRDL